MGDGPFAAIAIALLSAVACAALARLRRTIADTTLGPAWWWTLASVASVGGLELYLSCRDAGSPPVSIPPWAVAARFAASVSTFCPAMSVFGAKRPQDRAWSLIVFSLWVVLVLPAGELLLLGRGTRLEVQGLRAWFLVLLLFLGWVNALPTRLGWAGSLAAIAQLGLLAEHWPLLGRPISTELRIGAMACGVASLVLAAAWRPARPARPACPERLERPDSLARPGCSPLDRAWLDFRDLFGLVWALRVAERVNAVSTQQEWGVSLGWHGFRGRGLRELSREQYASLEQTIWNLWQRFVSRQWFDQRLGAAPPTARPDE